MSLSHTHKKQNKTTTTYFYHVKGIKVVEKNVVLHVNTLLLSSIPPLLLFQGRMLAVRPKIQITYFLAKYNFHKWNGRQKKLTQATQWANRPREKRYICLKMLDYKQKVDNFGWLVKWKLLEVLVPLEIF